MPYAERGIKTEYNSQNLGFIPNDIFYVALTSFVSRAPLFSRLEMSPVGSPTFGVASDTFRPSMQVLPTATIASGATSITATDGSIFLPGDVIEIESEMFLITAVSGNTLTVTGAYAGTTAAAHAGTPVAYLISNTRTGAEINQNGISRLPTQGLQYCQTVQIPYEVGGAIQSDDNYMGGTTTALDRDRRNALQDGVEAFEKAFYYGRGVPLATTTTRPQMFGLRNILTGVNKIVQPTNYNGYKPADFVRDIFGVAFDGGGAPDLILVSSDFMGALSLWGNSITKNTPGETRWGTKVTTFSVPFMPDAEIQVAPLLRKGTMVGLTSSEVKVRMKRPIDDYPRGRRGDAYEGDIIGEGAIEVDNLTHHVWVEGITAFAAP